jgi:kynurenine 3-monooxygenase
VRVRDVDLDRPALIVESAAGRREIDGDLVIGCDGAFSAVRGRMLHLDRFTYAQVYLEHGYKELHINPSAAGGFEMEPNALHIWPRHELMLIALPNDDGSFTVTLFLPFEGENSFASIRDSDEAVGFFERFFPDALKLMPDLRHQWDTHPTSSLHHVSCWPWHHRNRVLLLGDAAHAIVPFYGQGMNAAFEDCLALDRLIGELGVDALDQVIPAFATERKRHTDAIRDLAVENFVEMRSKVADPAFLQRKQLESVLGKAFPEQYRPLYEMISFSTLGYADARVIAAAQNAAIDEAPENTLGLLVLAFIRRLLAESSDATSST